MSKNEPAVEETVVAETGDDKIQVKINRDKYVATRTSSGSKSLSNGDAVATLLQGLTIGMLYEVADKAFKDNDFRERYGKLNVGMQRMNLGNRLRGWVSKRDEANEKLVAEDKEPKKAGIEAVEKFCAAHRKEADKLNAAAEKEKADKVEAATKAKADKAEAKADKAKKATKAKVEVKAANK